MITPDTKDWTWVLERPCPECGFAAAETRAADVSGLMRKSVARWTQILAGEPDRLRARPRPDVWSVLEYGCHARDVFVRCDERLRLMLTEDAPTFPNWDQDATAVEDRYGEQDPRRVADELSAWGETMAEHLDEVTGAQWERTGYRGDGAAFTVDTFARYVVHDVVHHLHDVGAPVR
ncbi:DinB family protein [Streptomyces sp. MAR4 CNX-425]|uniref:DinB family protein n=1 Tax=Streptomyces sp. MAR4 CNX-425 TaxID=3406343 RepID=UPI003B513428